LFCGAVLQLPPQTYQLFQARQTATAMSCGNTRMNCRNKELPRKMKETKGKENGWCAVLQKVTLISRSKEHGDLKKFLQQFGLIFSLCSRKRYDKQ
jgi:hypothetical protein